MYVKWYVSRYENEFGMLIVFVLPRRHEHRSLTKYAHPPGIPPPCNIPPSCSPHACMHIYAYDRTPVPLCGVSTCSFAFASRTAFLHLAQPRLLYRHLVQPNSNCPAAGSFAAVCGVVVRRAFFRGVVSPESGVSNSLLPVAFAFPLAFAVPLAFTVPPASSGSASSSGSPLPDKVHMCVQSTSHVYSRSIQSDAHRQTTLYLHHRPL